MQRRKFLSAAGVAIGATASSQVLGAFGGLDKVGGALGGVGAGVGGALGMGGAGAGGASWKDVAKQFGEAKALFATTAQQQAMISADIAEALDLKSAADVLRGEANNLAEKGDSMGSGDLNAVAENSASTQALIEAKLQESESLSDEQKAVLQWLSPSRTQCNLPRALAFPVLEMAARQYLLLRTYLFWALR